MELLDVMPSNDVTQFVKNEDQKNKDDESDPVKIFMGTVHEYGL